MVECSGELLRRNFTPSECCVKKLLRVSGFIIIFFSMKAKSCHIQTSSLSCQLTIVVSHG